MKILCVIQRFFPVIGGSEVLTKSILDYLSTNHEVSVYTTKAKDMRSFWNHEGKKIDEKITLNYSIKRFDFILQDEIKQDKNLDKFNLATNYPGPFSAQLWKDLVTKRPNCDLIFVTAFPYDHILPAFVSAKKWEIPLIILPLIHQEFPELYMTSLRMSILDNAEKIFVLSKSEKNLLLKKGITDNKITIFYPSLPETSQNYKNEKFYDYASIPHDKKIILFVGSKSLVKGIFFLIESMKKIWKTNKDLVLVLLGPNTNEFEEYFNNLPKNIKKNIFNFNEVDNEIKNAALSACQALAIPSISESLGLVYFEAWNFKKPVIGCNIPSSSELIEDKKNGILVKFDDVDQLSNAINYLVQNPSISKKMGEEGKKKVEYFKKQDSLKKFEKQCISTIQNFRNT